MSIARKAQPAHGFASTNPFVCNIFSHGLLRNERLLAPEGDPPAGGGAGSNDPPPKTFTQADVDSIIGKRVKEATAKFGDYEAMKTQLAELTGLKAKLEELETEKTMAGKSAEERAAAEAAKAAKRIETERAEFTTKLTAAEKRAADFEAKLLKREQTLALSAGLSAAKVLSSASEAAVRLMLEASKIEFDDEGKVASVTYGGVAHKTAAEAAAAFLKDAPYLAAAPVGGGGGTRPPNGGGGSNGRALHEQSEDELLRAGAR